MEWPHSVAVLDFVASIQTYPECLFAGSFDLSYYMVGVRRRGPASSPSFAGVTAADIATSFIEGMGFIGVATKPGLAGHTSPN